jgi:hypothetical protein
VSECTQDLAFVIVEYKCVALGTQSDAGDVIEIDEVALHFDKSSHCFPFEAP